jgi:tetratricopeptide (TPR) repeat protein
MPAVTYMVVDPRHDHSFRVPRPDLTAAIGVPNACNTCHKDKTPQWAAEAIDRWYPRTEPRPTHFAQVFAAARAGHPTARAPLAVIAFDPEQPGIVRATALQLLSAYGDVDALARGLRDPDPLVRVEAVRGLPDPASSVALLAPLLSDPVRLVRTEAAGALAGVPGALPDRALFDKALAEFRARQEAMLDRPEAHFNLGNLLEKQGDPRGAEREYGKAIELLPRFWPARANLSVLLNRRGKNDDAEAVLREAIALDPGNGEAHYSLGLLLAETDSIAAAAEEFAAAARLLSRPRVFYNWGIALQHLRQLVPAEDALLAGHRLAPDDADLLRALAILYAQRGEPRLALPYARRLRELVPNDPEVLRLAARIEADAR